LGIGSLCFENTEFPENNHVQQHFIVQGAVGPMGMQVATTFFSILGWFVSDVAVRT